VITKLQVQDHNEIIRLGIVSMPFPILFGLDWLKQHNPAIDWARGHLALSCCGANHYFPVSAFGKGYSLASPSVSTHISAIGLGLRLNNPPPASKSMFPDLTPKAPSISESFTPVTFSNFRVTASIIRPSVSDGLSHADLQAIWLSPLSPPNPFYGPPNKPIDIAHVSPERFAKSAKNQDCYCIWYTSNEDLSIRINSITLVTN